MVHLNGGGTMSGGHDAVIAQRKAPGKWRFVPLEGQSGDGIAVEDDVYASNPVFDDGDTFTTRAQAAGETSTTQWRYDAGKGTFTTTPETASN